MSKNNETNEKTGIKRAEKCVYFSDFYLRFYDGFDFFLILQMFVIAYKQQPSYV